MYRPVDRPRIGHDSTRLVFFLFPPSLSFHPSSCSNRSFPTFLVHVTRLGFLVYHRLVEYPWNAFFQREKNMASQSLEKENGAKKGKSAIEASSSRFAFFEDKSLSIKNDDVHRGRYTAANQRFLLCANGRRNRARMIERTDGAAGRKADVESMDV